VKGYSGFERITKPLPPVNIALHQISDPTSIPALPWFGLAGGFNGRAGSTDRWIQHAGGFNVRAGSTCRRIQRTGGFNMPVGSTYGRVQRTRGFNMRSDSTCRQVQHTGGFQVRADSTYVRIQHAGRFNVRAGSEPARTHVNHHHFQYNPNPSCRSPKPKGDWKTNLKHFKSVETLSTPPVRRRTIIIFNTIQTHPASHRNHRVIEKRMIKYRTGWMPLMMAGDCVG